MVKTLALILKKQNIGETDRLITIFSPTLGKKRVIARAVRKPLSKLAGHLDTFMVSQLILSEDTELPKVTSAVLIEPFEDIRSSLIEVDRAYAISKIVERVILEDVSQQTLFRITLDSLSRLNTGIKWSNVWLRFLSEVTATLGLQPSDFKCRTCNKTINSNAYWEASERCLYCRDCPQQPGTRAISANTVKLLGLLYQKQFTLLRRLAIPEAVALELEEILLREITEWFTKPWTNYQALRGKQN